MQSNASAGLPQVSLGREYWLRLAVVAVLLVLTGARCVPDLVRAAYPLNVFGYATDGDGVVVVAPATVPKGSDRIRIGDRVEVAKIKAFDRKPGIVGTAFTYDNPDRRLPIVRDGKPLTLHLKAHPETPVARALAILRIVLFTIVAALGAMLYLVKPKIVTFAFFIFCLSTVAPTTYLDLIIPNPWRPIPMLIDDTIRGMGRTALLLFAFCLIDGDEDAAHERVVAAGSTLLGLGLGVMNAEVAWRMDYLGAPAALLHATYTRIGDALTLATIAFFVMAWLRAAGHARVRTAWIGLAFAFAGVAQLCSDAFYPRFIPPWVNGVLVSCTVVPAVVVWVAVIKQRFFNVDFVVSRAIVYTSLTLGLIGSVTLVEEVGTYIFYNNTDLAYGFLIVFSMGVGALTGRIKEVLDRVVDRFIFRDRHAQRRALEFIAGYILDSETEEDVYRALLEDAPHALHLSFGGLFQRRPDGHFVLDDEHNWPPDCIARLEADHELTRNIAASRNVMTFSGKDAAKVRDIFPNERLSFAAPIFYERRVSAIVMYGHNISGLDLDPEERELLVRVVAHASIALIEIELERYRRAHETSAAEPHDLEAEPA
jgi:hypothetical protein